MNMHETTAIKEPLEASARSVTYRTRGRSHGPITRLVSPSDVGELIKPFVFLDYFEMDPKRTPALGFHPHSGIATLTLLLEGQVSYEETSGSKGVIATVGLVAATILMAACGSAQAPASPRVFFVQPQDGATVKSPVKLEFGIADYQIAAVPAGTVSEARPGMGHHHVGVDTDCLPVGAEIPKASPWVHFGTGNTPIDMQLPPGQHKLALQLGNDMHRTIEGLCTTITVNVVE